MKFSHIVLVVILSVVTAIAATAFFNYYEKVTPQATTTETAYDRVLRTGIIRCGYAEWPPNVFVKDPQTGKVSGVLADIAEAIAAKLKMKIEWTEETGWGSFIESLQSQRIDVMCAGIWRNGERGRYVGFNLPMFYSGDYPYVALDDHRFDKDLSLINQPNIRISTMDGEMSDVIAKEHFPKATEVSVPQLGQITDVLMNVVNHKADITFANANTANDFIKANPNKLRLAQDQPFQVSPTSFAVDIKEVQLRDMIDSAIAELHNQGAIENILSKYNADPKEFLRVAKPYEMTK